MINDEQLKKFVDTQLAAHAQFLVWMQDNNPGPMGDFHWGNVDHFVRSSKRALQELIAEPVEYEIALHALTADYIRQVWRQKNISKLTIRECSICDYPIKYLVNLSELYIDTWCNCSSRHEPPRYVGWQQLVDNIRNCQTEENKKETAKLYGFALL
jgi:hypothetical protein